MHKFFGHLHTINHHKRLVMKLCFRCGYYRQGLMHDLSKYAPIEFFTGVRYFQGNRSPNARDREQNGYSAAWFHHKGRNRHHWEYWTELTRGQCVPVKMPVRYVIEMWCDRIAATIVYEKEKYTDRSALNYFLRNNDNVIIHQDTKDLLELLLRYCADHGLDATITLIKDQVKTKGYDILKEKRNEAL